MSLHHSRVVLERNLGRKGVTEFKSVDHSIQNWVKANGCTNEPEIVALPDKADDGMRVTRKTWSGGKEAAKWSSSKSKAADTRGPVWSRLSRAWQIDQGHLGQRSDVGVLPSASAEAIRRDGADVPATDNCARQVQGEFRTATPHATRRAPGRCSRRFMFRASRISAKG